MSQHFTHLHLHTDFSLLDGAISLETTRGIREKKSVQSTCHYRSWQYFWCRKIFPKMQKSGHQANFGHGSLYDRRCKIKNAEKKYYHLILLVQNEIGYKNLRKLISFSFQQGFYFKPRIDYEILAKHSEGLIVTTACLGGHIPSLAHGMGKMKQQKNAWIGF